jgi:hemerythrin
MSEIRWDDSLELGQPVIDEQHKVLVSIMSRMAEALEAGAKQSELYKIFRELHRYSAFHFNEEEALMTESKFSVWYQHRHEHQKFSDALDALDSKLESGGCQFGPDTLEFLVRWHIEHISVSDKQLAECIP